VWKLPAWMRTFCSGLLFNVALAVATACAVTPFLMVPIPAILPYPLLLVPVVVAVMLWWARSAATQSRGRMLGFAVMAAGLSLLATVTMVTLPPFRIPSPNVIGRFTHLDGLSAYRLGVYELWCEIWVFLALCGLGMWRLIGYVAPRIGRPRRS
jgi:hypothetical protein